MKQFLGTIIVSFFLIAFCWGCSALILGHYGLRLPMPFRWLGTATWQAGPLLTLCVAAFAWSRASRWRRLEAMRDQWPGGAAGHLARGELAVTPPQRDASFLERVCRTAFLLGIVAIPYWLGANRPEGTAFILLAALFVSVKALRSAR